MPTSHGARAKFCKETCAGEMRTKEARGWTNWIDRAHPLEDARLELPVLTFSEGMVFDDVLSAWKLPVLVRPTAMEMRSRIYPRKRFLTLAIWLSPGPLGTI